MVHGVRWVKYGLGKIKSTNVASELDHIILLCMALMLPVRILLQKFNIHIHPCMCVVHIK